MAGKKPDLRDGMLERGPANAGRIHEQAGGLGEDVRNPQDPDTTDIARPGPERVPEGQNTHQ